MAVVALSTSNSVATTTAVSAATISIAAQTGSRVALYGAVCSYSVAPTGSPIFVVCEGALAATADPTGTLFKVFLSETSGLQSFPFVNFVASTSQAVTLRMSSGGCSAVLNAWWGYV